MPELPPKVETLVIVTTLNEQLYVTCPGLEIKLLNNIYYYLLDILRANYNSHR